MSLSTIYSNAPKVIRTTDKVAANPSTPVRFISVNVVCAYGIIVNAINAVTITPINSFVYALVEDASMQNIMFVVQYKAPFMQVTNIKV